MNRPVRVRFAAAPALPLHLGAARLALAGWLLARRRGGAFVLRLDDLDAPDTPATAVTADLGWLGLAWDECHRQSGRADRTGAAIARLQEAGRLYPCFETEAELNAKREMRLRRHAPAAYDRAMLRLTPAQRAAAEAGGKRPYWRFRLSDQAVGWRDAVLGRQEVSLPAHSDPVLVRADGAPMPALASAVDDLELGITHVLRPQDLIGATGVQIDLTAALGGDPASLTFAHLPAPEGGRTARLPTLRALRHDGMAPAALAAALTGAAAPARPSDLVADFDLRHAARAGLDMPALLALNRRALADLPFAAVADHLPHGATEAFWLAIRGGIDLLSEARAYWDVVAGTLVPPVIEGEGPFLRAALATLPPEPWNGSVWAEWTTRLEQSTQRGGEALAQPLRLALTGEDHGPDLAALLPVMGRARAAERLLVAAG